MLVLYINTSSPDFFYNFGVGMQSIYLIYLKSSPVFCQQLYLYPLSKIGLLLIVGSKSKYLVEIVGTFILVYAICSAATVYSGTNKLLGIAGLGQTWNDWSRFGCCFCFNCNSICYSIPLWSSG